MNNSAKIEENSIYQYNLYKVKNTLWYFNDLIKNGFAEYNSVKFKNNEGIYVWLENVQIDKENYSGNLAENGIFQKVLLNDVIDWMIIEEGRLIGGYTIRHYRDTLDEEAKINFDIDFRVKIDNGNDFFRPDLSTPEGVILRIENFYSEENLDGVLSCKDFIQEAENLLEERDVNISEELLAKIAETLKLSFIESLESNGFPYFKDTERKFSLKERHKNKELIEEKVIYADGAITYNK